MPLHDRFVTLLDEHQRILFKIARLYARTPSDRDDLIQEITLQLWRSFPRYDPQFRFSTWTYRVGLNVAISFVRREVRRPQAMTADPALIEITVDANDIDDEEMQQFHSFLWQQNELDRALLLLHLDGNRYDTIAEILGISESNVGTKLNRLKERFRRSTAQPSKAEPNHGTR